MNKKSAEKASESVDDLLVFDKGDWKAVGSREEHSSQEQSAQDGVQGDNQEYFNQERFDLELFGQGQFDQQQLRGYSYDQVQF